MIQVWDTAGVMPTAVGEGKRATGGRPECRANILEVVRATGRALTHKQLVRALREAGRASPTAPGR